MIQIRPATDADTPALAQIFLSCRATNFSWCAPESFFLSDFQEQTEGEVGYLAQTEEGRPIGFVSIWLPERFVGESALMELRKAFSTIRRLELSREQS